MDLLRDYLPSLKLDLLDIRFSLVQGEDDRLKLFEQKLGGRDEGSILHGGKPLDHQLQAERRSDGDDLICDHQPLAEPLGDLLQPLHQIAQVVDHPLERLGRRQDGHTSRFLRGHLAFHLHPLQKLLELLDAPQKTVSPVYLLDDARKRLLVNYPDLSHLTRRACPGQASSRSEWPG